MLLMTVVFAHAVMSMPLTCDHNTIIKSHMLKDSEILDQHQAKNDGGFVLNPPYKNAQSFIPTRFTLTKIEILFFIKGDPPITDIMFSVRDSQDGENLIKIERSIDDISTGWITFDCENLAVQPCETYYFICTPIGEWDLDWDNYVSMNIGEPNPYNDGCAWVVNSDGAWHESTWSSYERPCDYCFKIYGTNKAPNQPTAEFNRKDNILATSAADPENDTIRYGISWTNNDEVDRWTDYFESNEKIEIDCEDATALVGIISEDTYGEQSEWVSINAKNNAFPTIISNYLKDRPKICLLLQRLVETI